MTEKNGSIGELLAALNDIELPGGCERCDAFQTIRSGGDGMHALVIVHEDHCPDWLFRQTRPGYQPRAVRTLLDQLGRNHRD